MNPTTLTVSVLALSLWSGMAEAQTDVATSWQDLYAPYVSGAPLGEPLAGFGEGQTSLLTLPVPGGAALPLFATENWRGDGYTVQLATRAGTFLNTGQRRAIGDLGVRVASACFGLPATEQQALRGQLEAFFVYTARLQEARPLRTRLGPVELRGWKTERYTAVEFSRMGEPGRGNWQQWCIAAG